jgi:hypothetical protein
MKTEAFLPADSLRRNRIKGFFYAVHNAESQDTPGSSHTGRIEL